MRAVTIIFAFFQIFMTERSLSFSQFVSVFPSTFADVSTPNTHITHKNGYTLILRGGTPRNSDDLKSLIDFGIHKILIIKNETKNEVQNELAALNELNFPQKNVIRYKFLWKNFTSFKNQCEMTLDILKEIEKSVDNKQSTYFHCSVGEDRTGYISVLWKIYQNPNLKFDDLFNNELCDHGYEGANPNKGARNVMEIRAYTTKMLLLMFNTLKQASEKNTSLSDIQCPDIKFQPDPNIKYRCGPNSNF